MSLKDAFKLVDKLGEDYIPVPKGTWLQKEGELMELLELQAEVVKILMSQFDYEMEEAEEAVNKSVAEDPQMWNENAVADGNDGLAKYLATEEDSE